MFIHYGAFVGFSLGFNEATVSRKGEKKDRGKEKLHGVRGSLTADTEV